IRRSAAAAEKFLPADQIAARPRSQNDNPLDAWAKCARLLEQRQVFRTDDKVFRFGMIEHVGDLFSRERGVDWHEHRADLRRAEDRGEKLGAVVEEQRDLVALRDAEAREGAGGAYDLALELAVREAPRALDEQNALAMRARPLAQQLFQRVRGRI